MENEMGTDAISDNVIIKIFPSQNRFEAFLCHNDEVEKLHTGQLGQLLPHLAGLDDLYAKGCDANFKLKVKGKVNDVSWFSKSTMNRFLQLVGSPDFLNTSKAIEAEMSQLEQARNLYAQPEGKTATSDSSKRELLQAMNLRVTALLNELDAALKQATGATFCSEEITHLVKFCDHFGAADLKNSLCKLLKMSHSGDMAVLQNNCNHSMTRISRGENGHKVAGEAEKSGNLYTVTPVKYGVSPAIAAQVERQSSSESEESSYSSGENDTLAERGRALTVSAPARRLASPMRRVQIARTKSRRTPALTIKSLGYHPGRERSSVSRDSAASSGEEKGSEQPPSEKLESKMRMMTVQDAIHLFESKQKDQDEDDRKRSTLSSSSTHTVKPVLRRWSACATLSSSPSERDLALEDSAIHCRSSLPSNDVTDSEITVTDSPIDQCVAENEDVTQNFVKTTDPEVQVCAVNEDNVVDFQTDNKSSKEHGSERLAASSEWIRQKELEFNQMVKMMEHQDLKAQIPRTRKEVTPPVQKGGLYDPYEEKRIKKLRSEQAGKKTENGTQSRAMKQNPPERKSRTCSSKVKDHGKEVSSKKPHESLKSSSNSSSPGDESLKASVLKKVSSKTSNLSTSYKSLPSMLPSKTAKTSPSKFSPRNAESGTTPVHQKPLATPKLPSAKIERHNPHQRKLEETQTVSNSKLKYVKEEKHTAKKSEKEQKGKLAAAAGDGSGIGPLKSSSHGKMKKKSSVVPVEGKPLIRKGSGAANGVSPAVDNTNQSHQPNKSAAKPKNAVRTQNNQVSADASDPPNENLQQVIGSDGHNCLAAETEKLVERDQNSGKSENYKELSSGVTDDFSNVAPSLAEVRSEEESVISSTAWVENEIDEQQDMHLLNNNITLQPPSLVHVATVGLPNSRVRHSLSEMLREDSSREPDTSEWGNAENPPPLAYQRDALKGLKKLLKFSRNIKGDVNITELSSLSTFSEGDDVNEIVAVNKRNNYCPPSKEALHSNVRKQETMNVVESSAQPNFGRFNVQNAHKMHKDHVSTEVPKTKGRSFFSLSAFRNS